MNHSSKARKGIAYIIVSSWGNTKLLVIMSASAFLNMLSPSFGLLYLIHTAFALVSVMLMKIVMMISTTNHLNRLFLNLCTEISFSPG